MDVSVGENVEAVDGPIKGVLRGDVERQIMTLLERHFKGTAHLVELELLMRLPREEMASELENLYRAGLVSKEVRASPGERPYMRTCIYTITDKGIDGLRRLNGDSTEENE